MEKIEGITDKDSEPPPSRSFQIKNYFRIYQKEMSMLTFELSVFLRSTLASIANPKFFIRFSRFNGFHILIHNYWNKFYLQHDSDPIFNSYGHEFFLIYNSYPFEWKIHTTYPLCYNNCVVSLYATMIPEKN